MEFSCSRKVLMGIRTTPSTFREDHRPRMSKNRVINRLELTERIKKQKVKYTTVTIPEVMSTTLTIWDRSCNIWRILNVVVPFSKL